MGYEFRGPKKSESEKLKMEVENLLDSIERSGLSLKNKISLKFWADNAVESGVSLQQIKEVKDSVDALMSLFTIYRINHIVFDLQEVQISLDVIKRIMGDDAIEEEEWMK